jgi:hypothetical protein
MLIYKMTHLPTGKFYIGSLQRSGIWHKYNTSSKIVKSMMLKNPEEWIREVVKQYTSDYDPQKLVDEEYALIDAAVEQVGWDGIWNLRGSTNLGSSGYSPEARAKQKATTKDPNVIAKSKLAKQAFIAQNPDYFERISATAKSTWNTTEMKAFASKRATKQFANKDNRELASKIKKEYLSLNPEDVNKSLDGIKKARENPLIESERIRKITATMRSKSDVFSAREKTKHALNPDLGKQHGERLKALNQAEPTRQQKMSLAARKKAASRPDLVAKSIKAMNSDEARSKMKASLLIKYGKWVEITFQDGEKIQIFGAKETGRLLGIEKISRRVTQKILKKPVICTVGPHKGKEVISFRYVDDKSEKNK